MVRLITYLCRKGAWERSNGGRLRRQLQPYQRAIQESSWQQAVTSERGLTMHVLILCSWQCPFHGRVRCSSTSGVFIGSTMRNALSGFTTMSIPGPHAGKDVCVPTKRLQCYRLPDLQYSL